MYSQAPAAPPPPTFVEHYTALSYAITDHGYKFTSPNVSTVPIQTISFDNKHELVWSGNTYGHVSSYYGEQLTKYTSFSVGSSEPVLQILPNDEGLLCLLKDELKFKNRRGVCKFSYSSSTFKDMLCMSKLPSQLIILGGSNSNLLEFDIERQRQVRSTELGSNESGCCLIRQHPKFVCCADMEGRITIRNTNNLSVSHTMKTHSGQISDFDVHGNYLVTCGYSSQRPTPDRFLMIYDLRTFRLVTPIQSTILPSYLKFVPAFTTKFCIASQMGQFQILDVAASIADNCGAFTHHVNVPDSTITCLDVSTTGQGLAFSDDLGRIHLFGTNTNVLFNQYSTPIESADPVEPVPFLDVNDQVTPLSIIGQMCQYDPSEKSLSDDLNTGDFRYYATPKIDDKILKSMTYRSDVGYAPNPYRGLGHLSYIKGRVGVIGVTRLDDKGDDLAQADPSTEKEQREPKQDN